MEIVFDILILDKARVKQSLHVYLKMESGFLRPFMFARHWFYIRFLIFFVLFIVTVGVLKNTLEDQD